MLIWTFNVNIMNKASDYSVQPLGILLLSYHQAAAVSCLNLPIFGWFSSFIIRTSLKSCGDTEGHLMHTETCLMTLQAVTLSVSSVSAGKTLLETFIKPWWGSWTEENWATVNSQVCIRPSETGLHSWGTWEDLGIMGATVLRKAIWVMQWQHCTKPCPTQIKSRITTPLTRCSPASRAIQTPSQQHHTAAHCRVTVHRLTAS